MKYKTFITERLKIIPTTVDDAEFIYELLNTPKWIKYIGDRDVDSVKKAKEYIKCKMLPQLVRIGYSNYTVIRKVDNKKIGTCGLYDREGLEGIDIGYAFLPNYEGKGYAYEAANKILKAAFDDFDIATINAITSVNNLSSQRLLEKLGLQRIGTTILPNETEELILYRLDKVS